MVCFVALRVVSSANIGEAISLEEMRVWLAELVDLHFLGPN